MTKHVFVLLLLMTMTCWAQSPDTQTTAGARNGRFWESLPPTSKTYFIVGYGEAIRAALVLAFLGEAVAKGGKVDNEGRQFIQETMDLMFPKDAIVGDVVKGLDRLYAEPENLPLPISSAMRVLAMKFRSDKTDDIDAELRRLRILATKQ